MGNAAGIGLPPLPPVTVTPAPPNGTVLPVHPFAALMQRVSAACASNPPRITQLHVDYVMSLFGVPSIMQLNARPDLIDNVSAKFQELYSV
jgi:hypothetical protein